MLFFYKEPDRYSTPEHDGLTMNQRYTLLVACVVFYAFSFQVCWMIMYKFWPRFRNDYSPMRKADNCSRFNSCLNSVLVSPALLYGMWTMRWGPTYEPMDGPVLLQVSLFISVGYFTQDIYVTFKYKTPRWPIFLIHHFLAILPYLSYYFRPACHTGIFILCTFMLVECTNVLYNVQQWLEDVNRAEGLVYLFCVYGNIVGWIGFRLFNPAFSVYVSERYVVPSARPGAERQCLYPSLVCAYLVNAFCFIGFFTVILKDTAIRRGWVKSKKTKEVHSAANGVATAANGSPTVARRRVAKREQ